jgi:hypothetical protein
MDPRLPSKIPPWFIPVFLEIERKTAIFSLFSRFYLLSFILDLR